MRWRGGGGREEESEVQAGWVGGFIDGESDVEGEVCQPNTTTHLSNFYLIN